MICWSYKNNQCQLIIEWQPNRFIDENFCNTICKQRFGWIAEWAKNKPLSFTEQERQRLLAERPKGFQLAKNLLRHLKQIHAHCKQTGRIKVDETWRQARIAVCDKCPKMVTDDDGTRRCTVKTCGCYLDNPNNRPLLGGKAEYEALTCDEGNWTVIDFEYNEKNRE